MTPGPASHRDCRCGCSTTSSRAEARHDPPDRHPRAVRPTTCSSTPRSPTRSGRRSSRWASGYEQWDRPTEARRTRPKPTCSPRSRTTSTASAVKGGYVTVDVAPPAARRRDRRASGRAKRPGPGEKFLAEHTHADDEVRFFVVGPRRVLPPSRRQGAHRRCARRAISSGFPAGTRHWFDMGTDPGFTALRFFREPEGWVGELHRRRDRDPLPVVRSAHRVTQAVVLDIEGTTSSTRFVTSTLFPYARKRYAEYLRSHRQDPALAPVLEDVRRRDRRAGGRRTTASSRARSVDRCRRQGDGAQDACRAGSGRRASRGATSLPISSLTSFPRLRRWRRDGVELAVFSSGSVDAQRGVVLALPRAATCLPLLSANFDTGNAGPKSRGRAATERSPDRLGRPPGELMFLSDVARRARRRRATPAGARSAWAATASPPRPRASATTARSTRSPSSTRRGRPRRRAPADRPYTT